MVSPFYILDILLPLIPSFMRLRIVYLYYNLIFRHDYTVAVMRKQDCGVIIYDALCIVMFPVLTSSVNTAIDWMVADGLREPRNEAELPLVVGVMGKSL